MLLLAYLMKITYAMTNTIRRPAKNISPDFKIFFGRLVSASQIVSGGQKHEVLEKGNRNGVRDEFFIGHFHQAGAYEKRSAQAICQFAQEHGFFPVVVPEFFEERDVLRDDAFFRGIFSDQIFLVAETADVMIERVAV